MKKKMGGKRPGAGRPKTIIQTINEKTREAIEDAREFSVKKITEHLDIILTAQIDAAKGLRVAAKEMKTVTDKDGKERREWTGQYIVAYDVAPDTTTGAYLVNQVIGRPKETMEIGGTKGKPIEVNVTNMKPDELDKAINQLISGKPGE